MYVYAYICMRVHTYKARIFIYRNVLFSLELALSLAECFYS